MPKFIRGIRYEKWWRDLRFFVINVRAGGICEWPGCKHTANQVHHVHYPVGRRERESDLVALCDYHHWATHHPFEAANDNDQLQLDLPAA